MKLSFTYRKGNIWLVLLFIIYFTIINYSYYLLSSSAYSVEFSLDVNVVKLCVAYIWVLISLFLTMGENKISCFFIRMIIFFVIIPLGSVYGMRNENSIFYALTMITFNIIELLGLNNRLHKRIYINDGISALYRGTYFKYVSRVLSRSCLCLTLFLIVCLCIEQGLPSLVALDLYRVYEVRTIANYSKLISYLMSVVTCVFVPFGIAEGITNKNWVQVLFYISVQAIFFLYTGNKIYAFSLVLTVGLYIVYVKKWGLDSFFLAFTALSSFGCLSHLTSNSFFAAIFNFYNRRMVLDSAALKFFYYDFFIENENQITGLGGTILAPLFGIKTGTEYRYVLSNQYTGFTSNANTGLYGGDCACLGLFAFIMVPILLIFLIRCINRVSSTCGELFSLLFFAYIVYRLNETCIWLFFFDFTGIALIMLVLLFRVRSKKCVLKSSDG